MLYSSRHQYSESECILKLFPVQNDINYIYGSFAKMSMFSRYNVNRKFNDGLRSSQTKVV